MDDFSFIPPGQQRINPFFIVKNGAAAFIDFAVAVFGARERAEVRTPDRDGSLIHAEIQIGTATIMLADSKADWPFTPGFMQIYVEDINDTISKAVSRQATVVTEKSPFYGGFNIARIKDPFGNIWWLYERAATTPAPKTGAADTSWHERKPSYVYTSLMDAMKNLK